jgi:hypothetical protein
MMGGATRAGHDQCGAVAGEAGDAVNARSQWPPTVIAGITACPSLGMLIR